MAGDRVFGQLPDRFFKGFKQQMLLGLLSSETVEAILAPLLEHYDTVMPQLPADLQIDIENILKVYWEIAEKYAVQPSESVAAILNGLWEEWKQAFAAVLKNELVLDYSRRTTTRGGDARPESLMLLLGKIAVGLPHYGRGHFITDKGNPVVLELSYEEEPGRFCFRTSGLSRKVHVYLCGCPLLALQPEEEQSRVSLEKLLGVFLDIEDADMGIEIREE